MEEKYLILSIESSCDETSLALFENNELIAHKISSSASAQAFHGGVVPELASRYHEHNINRLFVDILNETKIDPLTITHVAYTAMPGLPGCLHVGKVFAKQLASLINAELVPINHLHAHVFSASIDQELVFPFLGLVVSGGESCLYLVSDYDQIKILNQTQDDAIGECYDKVARILGWNYPGGPIIDKNYQEDLATLEFIKSQPAAKNFSFSGLKTAVINYVHNSKQKKLDFDPIVIASSFQKFAINEVIKKVKYYLDLYQLKRLAIGGGVSANSLLRKKIRDLNVISYIPQMIYTGDNAAMIGAYAYALIKNHKKSILIK